MSFDAIAPPIPQAGGSKIVFASSRDGFMQIYVMNSDGTGQTRLTTDGSNNDCPHWSPNGTKILFQSDRDNPGSGLRDIYVMNADGSGPARLTTDANDDCNAAWSGDGTKIVFQSLRNGINYQIYMMNADGSGQVNISNTGATETQPSWSSDSTKIVFASDRDQAGFSSIYSMNANGSSQTRLTFSSTGFKDEQPAWSPDKTKIVFTTTRDSVLESWQETDDDGNYITKSKLDINKEVYVMNANGSGQTRLTYSVSNDDSPCWTSDGTRIVFRSERERDTFDATPQIWMMNSDGTNQTDLSNNGSGDFSASWSSGSANQSPAANAGGPYSGVVSQNAPFNGGNSVDPDGSIVNYSWNFGDGGTGSGIAPTHAYGGAGSYTVTLIVTDNLGAQGTASTTISISASSSDQYVTSFLQWGLNRPPNGPESSYWTDIMRAAYAQGYPSMQLAVRELGMTIFESAEYAARNRNDHWYVYDLYKTFLMRDPDADGWANWEAAVPIYGREQVRRAFDECTEFANIVATLNASGSPSPSVSSLATARVDPFNESGSQLQARDAEWSVSLFSLPGRAGLDLGLGLSYSSLVWTNSGPYMYFDADRGSPSPGFHIGFPTIQDKFFDAQVGRNLYLLTTAAGRKVELRQVGTSNIYESADSSYLQLIAGGNPVLRTTDGTSLTFGWTGINEYRCTSIEDRNGNFITINYDWRGDIQSVTDTLGRVITFLYDSNSNPTCVTQGWNGQPAPTTCGSAHTWATFGWDNVTMQPTLSGTVGTYSGDTFPALKMVSFDDGTYTKFLYNGNGQVNRITQYASDSNPNTDNHPRNYTAFDYDSATTDCPRLISTRTWAEYWTGINGIPNEVTTYLSVQGDTCVMTAPDGTVYKEMYAGTGDAAWMRGLAKRSEVWSGGVEQKVSTVQWTQDNIGLNYKTNPRMIETNVYDSAGNRKRTTIDYSRTDYAQYGLPYFVTEYAADGTTETRRTYTDYNLSQMYLDHRIIGLLSAVHLTDANGYQSKTTYGYDDPARLRSDATTAVMHDQGLDGSFYVRGNVTSISRWDVTDMNTIVDESKALTTHMNYNAAGSIVSTTDAAQHANSISYIDSFSDGNHNTFAYPTTLTNADGFSSLLRYDYDFGAATRIEGPPPQNQPNGTIQTFTYDNAARVQQVTTANDGAYTRYVYGPFWTQSFSTVNTIADEAYSITAFDGLDREFATAANHPGSTGGYRLLNTIYDLMGRAALVSNPTEVNDSWSPSGDDSEGVHFTQQTYDWKGRPRLTTNTDGTQKSASYSSCGCGGSEVITLTDETGRQERLYSDVLGRSWKTEVLTWPDAENNRAVYSTTASTFNARDQITLVRQFAGAAPSDENDLSCPTGNCEQTNVGFDGYGRLQSRHTPEQSAGAMTTWSYNDDDTIASITDGRGASRSIGYNGRHLVTGITYNVPYGVTATPNISFGYDAAGNRTSMLDGAGSVTYSYDSLSRMQSETRSFNGLTSYTLSYQYNLADDLTSVADPFGGSLSYGHDNSGRLNSVNGVGYGSVSHFAYNAKYRAYDSLKSLSYDSNRSLSIAYNNRMLPSLFQVTSPMQTVGSEYQYYPDGQISYSRDLSDPIFDRSYSYDQVSRMTAALTGSEARGGNTPDGPYNQTYSFDAWDNLTQRTGRDWSHNSPTVSFTYTASTNRNAQWQYDAEGNVTGQGTRHYSYDAADRQTRTSDNHGGYIDQDFDADGRKVKWSGVGWAVYYLRSTVLKGEVVAELNTQGQLANRYVYANGALLATQNEGGPVSWVHRSPNNNSEWSSFGNGVWRSQEFDPLGTDVGTEDPYLDGGGENSDWASGRGDPSDLVTGCEWEGMAIGCDYAVKFTGMRGYQRLVVDSKSIPGTGTAWIQFTHVRSRYIPLDHPDLAPEGSGVWSPGDTIQFKTFISTPDTDQTSIVRSHHTQVSQQTKAVPCDVQLPTDSEHREIVGTLMGEMTQLDATQYGTDQRGNRAVGHPSGPQISRDDSYGEAAYMVSVIENRHRDWYGGKASYSDVVNAPGQFLGHDNGMRALDNLGNNGSEACERARIIVNAMNSVLGKGGVWNYSVYYWRGVEQWPKNSPPFVRAFRSLYDIRIGNTDFMEKDPSAQPRRRRRR